MATKKTTKASKKVVKEEVSSEPLYPYTTTPNSLRRFLEMVPQKPKPPRITGDTLKVWGFKNSNDATVLRALKKLELLNSNGDTTPIYAEFMHRDIGASVLGRQIKSVYSALFENVANPGTASTEELTNFFNIHSGGSEKTIRFQIDTFKALAAYATFGESDPLETPDSSIDGTQGPSHTTRSGSSGTPPIHIDLHIHLPENKSKSDYDAIMESIANHLYKRNP
jgi:hypothetical protein